jgi:hypothetical protein
MQYNISSLTIISHSQAPFTTDTEAQHSNDIKPAPSHGLRVQNQQVIDLIFVGYVIWANYNDLTATSLGMMVSKGNHPQMTLIQVSEIL